MTIEIEKAQPVKLRSIGLDEKWLQERISDDPSLLGLGNLEIVGREHAQPMGGRIDFLMRDEEEEIFYEVEIMLGGLDESHIIRAIEYWDIERQRRPQWDHRAVIVAEDITARFFNVLRLLNRAVPLIGIKLSTFKIGDRIFLHPVTVIDVVKEVDPDILDPVERADRAYWEKKSVGLLAVLDRVVVLLRKSAIEPKVTYNRGHVALGSAGRNFCWFFQRKGSDTARIEIRLTSETRDQAIAKLQEGGIGASSRNDRDDRVALTITTSNLDSHATLVSEVLGEAEALSK
jgi:hypothetical protein